MPPEIRIASPCTADWERMTGDQRVRHCAECNLDVYNFSAMTSREVEELLTASRGKRLCGRFYRRADGTMLTNDCPVGFRAVVRRVSRVAGAVLSAAMSTSFAVAQTPQKGTALTQIAPAEAGVEVVVADETGAVIPKAQVLLQDEKGAEIAKGLSNERGEYRVTALPAGPYVLTVHSWGFATYHGTVTIRSRETTRSRFGFQSREH